MLTPYIIKIVLTDENPYPKSKKYSLSVTVNPIAPIANKTMQFNPSASHKAFKSKVTYNLTMTQ